MSVVVGVGVIIINQQGEVLLGKRSSQHAPYWSIPGGHMEAGESFEQAAQREIFEETGLNINEMKVIGLCNNPATGVKKVNIQFRFVCWHNTPADNLS